MLNESGERIMAIQKTMRALADPIRREILNMLKAGRMSAGDITEKFEVTGASVSRHLSVLKEADLIRDTREGKFIYYELNASVLEEIMLWISGLKGDSNNAEEK
jgi:DNA-binding transcriptional ArsR family regulator